MRYFPKKNDLRATPSIDDKAVCEIQRFNVDSVPEGELRLVEKEGMRILMFENSNLSPDQVSATLLQLALRGLVRKLIGKVYISNCVYE